jgi:hypothetical protein
MAIGFDLDPEVTLRRIIEAATTLAEPAPASDAAVTRRAPVDGSHA